MFDQLKATAEAMELALADLDTGSMIGTQPARGLELLGRHERAVAAARAKLTARAEEMRQWHREGYRSFEEWYAAVFGTSVGQARRRARAAKKLADSDRTAEALADGDISEDEADVVADAANKNPGAEKELLDTARNKHKSHKDLKDRAAKAKAAGEDDGERAERLRQGRTAGWGTDRDGFWTLDAKLQPEVGAEIKACLQAETDRIFSAARQAGAREGHDRYRADALANLIRGPQPTSESPPPAAPPGRELVLDIDLAALRRGCVNPGETCAIRGVGPVPVEVARSWVDDAFIKAVIRDGTDVHKVAHYGRHIPATVRTALGLVDQACAVPGCTHPRLEYDHKHTHAAGGACSTDNLRPLCVHHHRQRTHDGYELTGEPGDRRWLGPDGRILFADQPHHLTAEPARAP